MFLFVILGIFSENEDMAEKARNLIIRSRNISRKSKAKKVRKLKIPYKEDFNLDATNFMDLLKWDKISPKMLTQPPMLMKYSDEELKDLKKEMIPRFKCHSQDNERFVQEVAKAASRFVGIPKQKMNIICASQSRAEISITANKSDFY